MRPSKFPLLFALLAPLFICQAALCQSQAPRRNVVVEMKGGAPITGSLVSLDTERVQLDDQGRLVTIALDDVSRSILDFMTVTPDDAPTAYEARAVRAERPTVRRASPPRRTESRATRSRTTRGRRDAGGRNRTARDTKRSRAEKRSSRSSARRKQATSRKETARRGKERPATRAKAKETARKRTRRR